MFPHTPEDFLVDELPLYPPKGEGAHTFVHVEKRLRTTEQVARELARAAGVPARDVGYAGRKDRVAVTRQWFSVPGLEPDAAHKLELRDARVLEAVRHPHKLRTGQLRANRFTLTLRDLTPEGRQRAEERLAQCTHEGMPNRFGHQRFGRDAKNIEMGQRLLRGERIQDRRAARFYVSALQAAVFNRVLETRPIGWGELEVGDVAMVHTSGGLFHVEDLPREAPRAQRFEISATGPIFGSKMRAPAGRVAEWEASALQHFGVDAKPTPPRGVRLAGARRALRVRPENVAVESGDDVLRLEFTLPPGSYATVLLEEILDEPA